MSARADLVREGDGTDRLFLVTAGWACRYATTSSGGRKFVALLVPGDVCNVDSLVLDRLDYGVLALTAVKTASLSRWRATALANECPGIARTFTWLAMLDNLILRSGSCRLVGDRQRSAWPICSVN